MGGDGCAQKHNTQGESSEDCNTGAARSCGSPQQGMATSVQAIRQCFVKQVASELGLCRMDRVSAGGGGPQGTLLF